MAYKDVLDKVNTEYYYSVNAGELSGSLDTLLELLSQKSLNAEYREQGDALKLRIAAKMYALIYLDSLEPTAYADLNAFIDEALPSCEEKGYVKTVAVLRKLSAVAARVDALITPLTNAVKRLGDGSTPSACDAAIGLARDISACAANADFGEPPFGEDVEFVDINKKLVSRIGGIEESVRKLYRAALERSISGLTRNITEKYGLFEFFPTLDYEEGGKANALIVCTPFAEEARLFAVNAAGKQKVLEFDAGAYAGGEGEFYNELMSYVLTEDAALAVVGAGELSDKKRDALLSAAMRAGLKGLKTYIIYKSGDGKLYDRAMELGREAEDFGEFDVSVSYVSMPSYADLREELTNRGMLESAENSEKLKKMPFMGYIGVNRIVKEFIAGKKNWADAGVKLSEANSAAAKRYLTGLASALLFIDSGWGEFKGGRKIEESDGGYDYDEVKDVDLENVRRIMESDTPVFARCGMIVRYCTVGGEDYAVWKTLPREEIEERLTLATKLVYQILRIPIVPKVEVLDKLSNSGAGGLCCQRGQLIQYKYSCCLDSWDWMLGCIVHESFHAFQYKLMDGGWTQWSYDELGVTRGRVERWRITNKIYDSDVDSDVYKVHMIEADAKAFEVDCAVGRDYYWSTVELD